MKKECIQSCLQEYKILIKQGKSNVEDIKKEIHELCDILLNLKFHMRRFTDFYDNKKLGNIDVPKKYKYELLRPITDREMNCYRLCLNNLQRDDIHGAYHELLDMFYDYGKCEYKRYISISETCIFADAVEQFKEYFAGPSKETDWGEVPVWNCDDEIEQ